MAWGEIKSDCSRRIPVALRIDEYLYKNHGISVPPQRQETPKGITITAVPVYLYEKGKTNADLTAKQIVNRDPVGLIPHYYCSISSTWQVLELDSCWQRSDGHANDKTICIAVTMTDGLVPWAFNLTPINAAARLTAYLLDKYKLSIQDVSITKNCPEFFTSRWKEFKQTVQTQLKKL